MAEPSDGYYPPVGQSVSVRSGCGVNRAEAGAAMHVALLDSVAAVTVGIPKVLVGEFRCADEHARAETAPAEPGELELTH